MSTKLRTGSNAFRHGLSGSRIWWCWSNMLVRCNNKNGQAYDNYGGRGVKVCERWSKFENFYADMKDGYTDKLLLDRVDNNGNYCKQNCRWATRTEQNNNTRRNRFITFNNQTMTLSQWARNLGIKTSTLGQRYYTYKWNIEKCLTHNI